MEKIQNLQQPTRGWMGKMVPLLGCLLLAGCQINGPATGKNAKFGGLPGNKSRAVATSVPVPAPVPVQQPEPVKVSPEEKRGMELCQSELASLQEISPERYAAKKAVFDKLLRNASVYTSVRGKISIQTKNTLDALYKYKTNHLCSEIERDVLDSLIRRGESVK